MSTDLTIYNDFREIPNSFMNGGANSDGQEGDLFYIDCNLIVAGGSKRGICCGIVAKSTNDASGLAQIKVRGRDGSAIVTLPLALGIMHPANIVRLYPSDANGVVLCY